jgi:hypothetical protein
MTTMPTSFILSIHPSIVGLKSDGEVGHWFEPLCGGGGHQDDGWTTMQNTCRKWVNRPAHTFDNNQRYKVTEKPSPQRQSRSGSWGIRTRSVKIQALMIIRSTLRDVLLQLLIS